MRLDEIMSNVGRKGFYNCNGLDVLVEITKVEVREITGEIVYDIKPVAGRNQKLISLNEIRFPTSEGYCGNDNS